MQCVYQKISWSSQSIEYRYTTRKTRATTTNIINRERVSDRKDKDSNDAKNSKDQSIRENSKGRKWNAKEERGNGMRNGMRNRAIRKLKQADIVGPKQEARADIGLKDFRLLSKSNVNVMKEAVVNEMRKREKGKTYIRCNSVNRDGARD